MVAQSATIIALCAIMVIKKNNKKVKELRWAKGLLTWALPLFLTFYPEKIFFEKIKKHTLYPEKTFPEYYFPYTPKRTDPIKRSDKKTKGYRDYLFRESAFWGSLFIF